MGVYNTLDNSLKLSGMGIAFLLVLAIIAIAIYVIQALFLNYYNKYLTGKSTWLAWIPVANKYLLGKLVYNDILGWGLVALGIFKSFNDNFSTLYNFILIGCYVYALVNLINYKSQDRKKTMPKMSASTSDKKEIKKPKGINSEMFTKMPGIVDKINDKVDTSKETEEYQSQPAMRAPISTDTEHKGFDSKPKINNSNNSSSSSGSLQDFYRR